MPSIIIRDDDTSYFTSPRHLERLYGRLWAAGLPVCIAAIPRIFADARVYWSAGNPHDPSIPPGYQGKSRNYALQDNQELCAFLNQLAGAGLVELCMHGCAHTFHEFISHDRAVIANKLQTGAETLRRAIPAARVTTFVPPYDRISPIALEALAAAGYHICTMSHNLAPLPAWPQIRGFAAQRIADGRALFVCDDYIFTHKRAPAESLKMARAALARNKLTIVCNHYWMFSHPWRAQPNPADMTAWNALLDELLAADDCELTTFSAYAARISQ